MVFSQKVNFLTSAKLKVYAMPKHISRRASGTNFSLPVRSKRTTKTDLSIKTPDYSPWFSTRNWLQQKSISWKSISQGEQVVQISASQHLPVRNKRASKMTSISVTEYPCEAYMYAGPWSRGSHENPGHREATQSGWDEVGR